MSQLSFQITFGIYELAIIPIAIKLFKNYKTIQAAGDFTFGIYFIHIIIFLMILGEATFLALNILPTESESQSEYNVISSMIYGLTYIVQYLLQISFTFSSWTWISILVSEENHHMISFKNWFWKIAIIILTGSVLTLEILFFTENIDLDKAPLAFDIGLETFVVTASLNSIIFAIACHKMMSVAQETYEASVRIFREIKTLCVITMIGVIFRAVNDLLLMDHGYKSFLGNNNIAYIIQSFFIIVLATLLPAYLILVAFSPESPEEKDKQNDSEISQAFSSAL